MKSLKALLALAVAMTATSSFAETANPLTTFKESAKTSINEQLSSAKQAATNTQTATQNSVSQAKNAMAEKVKSEAATQTKTARETLNSVKTQATDKATSVKAQAADKVTAAKESVKNAATQKMAKINVNKADAATLQQLSGIGEAKAKAIVEYRNKVGKIKNAAELSKISGIGSSTIEKISPFLTF